MLYDRKKEEEQEEVKYADTNKIVHNYQELSVFCYIDFL